MTSILANSTSGDRELTLRCVHDILDERFVVPSYQRGYRWTQQEVHDLLNDIRDFARSDNLTQKSFYCLQPVVVRRVDGICHVIDGQQRLTTIRLLLTFLKESSRFIDDRIYAIQYASRPKEHSDLLDRPRDIDGKVNIDLHHIREAYLAIESWCKKEGNSGYRAIESTILNTSKEGRNVQVIWYELDETEQPIDVFVRLNIGKIPLTNAELIRALLLNGSNFKVKAAEAGTGETPPTASDFRPYEIAQDWDNIERTLQDDHYWHFLAGMDAPASSRIDLLFELLVGAAGIKVAEQRYGVFFAYSELAEKSRTGNASLPSGRLWWDVKRLALRLDEWFRDRRMYHLVGCLVALASAEAAALPGGNARAGAVSVLVKALQASEREPRSKVRETLRKDIRERLFGAKVAEVAGADTLKEVLQKALTHDFTYDTPADRGPIRSVLLTFNVATHLSNVLSNHFFPFDAFQKQSWDIEHIRATMDQMPRRVENQKAWLSTLVEYLGCLEPEADAGLAKKAGSFVLEAGGLLAEPDPFDRVKFEALYRRALEEFGTSDSGGTSTEGDDGDSIFNLALLDSGTNRKIGHALFPIKRREVLARERDGLFVPVCTRNVFLKYYTQNLGNVRNMMYWNAQDRKAYGQAMVENLAHFFLED